MNRPILLDYALLRTIDDNKAFKYDYSKDMNVIKHDTEKIFINSDIAPNLTQTETRVQRESDDIECSFMELETKTEVTRERDEDTYSLLELLTKTSEDRERDDEDMYSLVELESKTFTNRERDDEDDYYLN